MNEFRKPAITPRTGWWKKGFPPREIALDQLRFGRYGGLSAQAAKDDMRPPDLFKQFATEMTHLAAGNRFEKPAMLIGIRPAEGGLSTDFVENLDSGMI